MIPQRIEPVFTERYESGASVYYATYDDFTAAILEFFRETLPENWERLRDTVTDNFRVVNRHSTVTHYQRPTVTQLQEGGTGGELSEILFFSAKSKRRPSLIYPMQIIPVCLSIVARRKGVSATRRGGSYWTPISLLVGHPCKLFHIPGDFDQRV